MFMRGFITIDDAWRFCRMPRNLDVAALRSFIAVAETGGVTRAAQRLHLTQSGVSMQVKRLEEAMDVQLLAREGRGVVLTKIGEELLTQARKMVSLNDEIWERMRDTPMEGELRLGIPHDIVSPFAPPVLRRFHRDFPAVRVSLISPPTSELLAKLESGECDVILTTENGVRPGGETLAQRRLTWVGAPAGRAWRRRPVPLATDPRCAFRKPTFDALEAAGLSWEWVISTANYDAITATTAADLAVLSLLEGTAPQGLQEVEHDGELPDLPLVSINLYVNGGASNPLADRLADYVREVLAAFENDAAKQGRAAA